MTRCLKLVTCFVLGCAGTIAAFGQADTDIESPKHKAWDMLMTASFSKRTVDRTNGIRALGLLRENTRARQLAENALSDSNPDVRSAAATALGQMHATAAIPKLQKALSDKKIPVVMAAAHSLRELDDNKSAYEVYYDLLTGERKSNDGLIAQQINTLKDPKELAKIGISEGIGYIPFAGIGWDAYRTMRKKDPNPARAVAATLLAHDPDPASAKALVKATCDKDWIVRAAAVEAIAQRGDPALLPKVQEKFSDKNPKVRYSAAAAVIRLTAIEQAKTAKNNSASHAATEHSVP
ncbi:MAG TPA: HEAT repeat domain-containing protein [Candidatus Sulfotelmatobacter sp.]|nr:HEAT repeat domain-containing protein [Candidatus Sulfotelmatobacter sp.]